jgi:hypothetical protein
MGFGLMRVRQMKLFTVSDDEQLFRAELLLLMTLSR